MPRQVVALAAFDDRVPVRFFGMLDRRAHEPEVRVGVVRAYVERITVMFDIVFVSRRVAAAIKRGDVSG